MPPSGKRVDEVPKAGGVCMCMCLWAWQDEPCLHPLLLTSFDDLYFESLEMILLVGVHVAQHDGLRESHYVVLCPLYFLESLLPPPP